ncbi:hypothetical protein Pcinc_022690 [Petrolisthes cinctipes]|uniref:EGF-like domain-containing protein n=1 Tax=Petrolisthes cinctipes TaxID=88211 RepID=A0AAE1FFU5_PETCI|nr:hypothetical protein Pcinc_022690 [Petrolisthes cinctipes]
MEKSDCPANKKCEGNTCTCITDGCDDDDDDECTKDGDCTNDKETCDEFKKSCVCEKNYVRNINGVCVECVEKSDCPANKKCEGNTCTCITDGCDDDDDDECTKDGDCTNDKETCDEFKKSCVCEKNYVRNINGVCVECVEKSDCPANKKCEGNTCTCITEGCDDDDDDDECTEDGDCTNGKETCDEVKKCCVCKKNYVRKSDGDCVECVEKSDCPANKKCEGNTCTCITEGCDDDDDDDECTEDGDCTNGKETCDEVKKCCVCKKNYVRKSDGDCVECVEKSDCPANKKCEGNTCTCITDGCDDDDDDECTEDEDCTNGKETCDEVKKCCVCKKNYVRKSDGDCVECVEKSDCPANKKCEGNTCTCITDGCDDDDDDECTEDGDCTNGKETCDEVKKCCVCKKSYVRKSDGDCVECVEKSDCPANKKCEGNTCTCITDGCDDDDDDECTEDGDCTNGKETCDEVKKCCVCKKNYVRKSDGDCVECVEKSDCPANKKCEGNTCTCITDGCDDDDDDECTEDGDCTNGKETCDEVKKCCVCKKNYVRKSDGDCVECVEKSDCPANKKCEGNTCTCITEGCDDDECTEDGDCTNGKETCDEVKKCCVCKKNYVRKSDGDCVECVEKSDCPANKKCEGNTCTCITEGCDDDDDDDECTEDGDCTNGKETCDEVKKCCVCKKNYVRKSDGDCVECVEKSDCPANKKCEGNTCTCITEGCDDDDDDDECTEDGDCTNGKETCDEVKKCCVCKKNYVRKSDGDCVECVEKSDCPANKKCEGNTCTCITEGCDDDDDDECTEDGDCTNGKETCDEVKKCCVCKKNYVRKSDGDCVECVEKSDCPANKKCEGNTCTCITEGCDDDDDDDECTEDGDCTNGKETCDEVKKCCVCKKNYVRKSDGDCVECVEKSDCPANKKCEGNTCTCITEGCDDDECTEDGDCTNGKETCDEVKKCCVCKKNYVRKSDGDCVECVEKSDCPANKKCEGNTCTCITEGCDDDECTEDGDCTNGKETCDEVKKCCVCKKNYVRKSDGDCVECVEKSDCPANKKCEGNTCTCITEGCDDDDDDDECTEDGDCTNGKETCDEVKKCCVCKKNYVRKSDGDCVECVEKSDCPANKKCEGNTCTCITEGCDDDDDDDECTEDGDCTNGKETCDEVKKCCVCKKNYVRKSDGDCVECVEKSDCPANKKCEGNTCTCITEGCDDDDDDDECTEDGDCTNGKETCDEVKKCCVCKKNYVRKSDGDCVECVERSDCPANKKCEGNTCTCITEGCDDDDECTEDGDCTNGKETCDEVKKCCVCKKNYVRKSDGDCVECVGKDDCSKKQNCEENTCVDDDDDDSKSSSSSKDDDEEGEENECEMSCHYKRKTERASYEAKALQDALRAIQDGKPLKTMS